MCLRAVSITFLLLGAMLMTCNVSSSVIGQKLQRQRNINVQHLFAPRHPFRRLTKRRADYDLGDNLGDGRYGNSDYSAITDDDWKNYKSLLEKKVFDKRNSDAYADVIMTPDDPNKETFLQHELRLENGHHVRGRRPYVTRRQGSKYRRLLTIDY